MWLRLLYSVSLMVIAMVIFYWPKVLQTNFHRKAPERVKIRPKGVPNVSLMVLVIFDMNKNYCHSYEMIIINSCPYLRNHP